VGLLVVNLDAVKWEDLSRERIKQVALFIGIAVALTTLFVLLAIGGASLGWTGFGDKTFWDWLQLLSALAIPVVLAAAGFWFTAQQDQRQEAIEKQRAESAQEIEEQRAQDEALQAYLDQMNTLLLEEKLRASEEGSEVRTLARARTLTVLGRLDPKRKAQVMQFLVEARLVQSEDESPPLIRLSGANLRGVYLSDVNLRGADLRGANLKGVDLVGEFTVLDGADLSDANLTGAVLHEPQLKGAVLYNANLSDADLENAWFAQAGLSGADLSDTNLRGANLGKATLMDADLTHAVLTHATLIHAVLIEADLSGAVGLTNEQIAAAESLYGATMPNGQKYEDWLKSTGTADATGTTTGTTGAPRGTTTSGTTGGANGGANTTGATNGGTSWTSTTGGATNSGDTTSANDGVMENGKSGGSS
jgi:uncharacterized protein YjbI with pentapeptide repeats